MIKRINLSEQIRQSIIDYIRKNELRPGDKLPTEKEFSELFQASRTSIREAIKSLSLNGTLETIQGKGTFLLPAADALIDGNGINPLNDQRLRTEHRISDLTEIRIPLEVTAAKLAALRATKDEVEQLRVFCEEYRSAVENNLSAAEPGRQFHIQVALMSKNPLLFEAINAMVDKMHQFRGALAASHRDQEFSCRSHEDICNAISAGDAQAAAEHMLAHIMTGNAALMSLVREDYKEILLNE